MREYYKKYIDTIFAPFKKPIEDFDLDPTVKPKTKIKIQDVLKKSKGEEVIEGITFAIIECLPKNSILKTPEFFSLTDSLSDLFTTLNNIYTCFQNLLQSDWDTPDVKNVTQLLDTFKHEQELSQAYHDLISIAEDFHLAIDSEKLHGILEEIVTYFANKITHTVCIRDEIYLYFYSKDLITGMPIPEDMVTRLDQHLETLQRVKDHPKDVPESGIEEDDPYLIPLGLKVAIGGYPEEHIMSLDVDSLTPKDMLDALLPYDAKIGSLPYSKVAACLKHLHYSNVSYEAIAQYEAIVLDLVNPMEKEWEPNTITAELCSTELKNIRDDALVDYLYSVPDISLQLYSDLHHVFSGKDKTEADYLDIIFQDVNPLFAFSNRSFYERCFCFLVAGDIAKREPMPIHAVKQLNKKLYNPKSWYTLVCEALEKYNEIKEVFADAADLLSDPPAWEAAKEVLTSAGERFLNLVEQIKNKINTVNPISIAVLENINTLTSWMSSLVKMTSGAICVYGKGGCKDDKITADYNNALNFLLQKVDLQKHLTSTIKSAGDSRNYYMDIIRLTASDIAVGACPVSIIDFVHDWDPEKFTYWRFLTNSGEYLPFEYYVAMRWIHDHRLIYKLKLKDLNEQYIAEQLVLQNFNKLRENFCFSAVEGKTLIEFKTLLESL